MNQLLRFLLDDLDIRGTAVRLGSAWRAMTEGRAYPPGVAPVLGELAAVVVALAGQMKSDGRLGFQLHGNGPISRLVLDCDHELRFRGMARAAGPLPEQTVAELLGHGQLVMTLDLPELKQPMQSIVPLQGNTISAIFEHFIAQSEQQPTRLLLAANDQQATALLLQKMPEADRKNPDGWNQVEHLLSTIKADEILTLPSETLLLRVFHETAVRVFEPRQAHYHCPENWPKIRAMLQALDPDEVRAVFAEQGEIVVTDDICNRTYRIDEAALQEILPPPPNRVLH